MSDPSPLPPGSTLGILGGGQLGRMLALAAARLGLRAHVYDPASGGPAAQVAAATHAPWDDADALGAFAARCDVVTLEWENVPPAALAAVEASGTPLRPGRRAVEISADRAAEKAFLREAGLDVAPFALVHDAETLAAGMGAVGLPALLKTRAGGYDGRGQARLVAEGDAPAALAAMNGAPAILEARIAFDAEISVIAARGVSGETAAYDPGRNHHEDGILRRTAVPAGLRPALVQDAVLAAGRVLAALDYVGVMGIEFFVAQGRLVANEYAPRVHNSGHWTQGACAVDQFEQHVRAVAGWPLGDGSRHADCEMENLLGDDDARWEALAREPGTGVHLYGKAGARRGRKMGHANRLRPLGAPPRA